MKFSKGLAFRISMGYVLIALLSVLVFAWSFFILNENKEHDRTISDNIAPATLLFKDMNALLSEVKRLDNSWIYTPNAVDKARLTDVLKKDYVEAQAEITALMRSTSGSATAQKLDSLSFSFNQIITSSSALTTLLATDDDYADDAVVDLALSLFEKEILPKSRSTEKIIAASIRALNREFERVQQEKQSSYRLLSASFLFMLAATLATGVISMIVSIRMIVRPLEKLKEVVNTLGRGTIVELKERKSEDEISEMQNSIRTLVQGIKDKIDFAVHIGKGNYERTFTPLSDGDQMGQALLDMRKSLKESAEEEGKRSWITTGVAQLGDILRKQEDSLTALADEVIRFIVKYTGANQGGIFIVEKDNSGEEVLELKACYAYERKKHVGATIRIGQGLVGQCFLERQLIQLTELPENYVKITSGLGEAPPGYILIVPLKYNDSTFGVFELASFTRFPQHCVDFLEKISENIASTVSSVKNNEWTKGLLTRAQDQAMNLKSREEELKQNMEELTATHEEMARKESEYLKKIQLLEERSGVHQD